MEERAGTASAGPCEMGCSTHPLPTILASTARRPSISTDDGKGAGSIPAGRTKLYVVVRNNLSPGAKACQAAHALRAYADHYPFIESWWWRHSNTLVMLEAPEDELVRLEVTAHQKKISCVRFVEPDWSPAGDLTALVLGPDAKRLVSALKLAYGS